jgi:hypothetical protein
MQIYISKSLEGLDYKSKYNLKDYTDSLQPLYIFGMYRDEDFEVLKNHQGECTIIWQGMDAKEINENWIERIKEVNNISISHWISESLNNYEIEHTVKYLSATKPNIKNHPNGDCIYFYSSDLSDESADYHGEYLLKRIKKRTGLKVIRAVYNSYTKRQLMNIYKKCFINLRLTKYDGCPNTNLEMGLMGRKSIFNGDLPHSIKWNDLDDICESIMTEYKKRNNDNKQVSIDFLNFINDNNLQ